MKLLSDIINELVDSEISFESPFLKTKVLAAKLKNEQLLDWVNSELNGYSNTTVLPEIRKPQATLVCSWINGNRMTGIMHGQNQYLPKTGYGEYWDDYFSTFPFTESVATLESYINSNKSTVLSIPLDMDVCAILAAPIQKQGNYLYSIVSASKQIATNSVISILSCLRNNLLDFMLKLDEEFGNVTDLDNLNDRNKINNKIQTIMNHTNIIGNGNVLTSGSQNVITNQVGKGDFQTLERQLIEKQVSAEDIKDLANVIGEKPDNENKEFGAGVNKWLRKMLDKSLDGTWKVGIGVATKFLTDIISSYYGM